MFRKIRPTSCYREFLDAKPWASELPPSLQMQLFTTYVQQRSSQA